MRQVAVLAIALLFAYGPASAGPSGGIVFPEEGSCHGPAALPIDVRDDFTTPFAPLSRRYDPPGGLTKEVSPDGRGGGFGGRIVMQDDVLVVGAAGADDVGAAYVFRLRAGAWELEQVLAASDPAEDGWFGSSLALEGSTLVVGAVGDDDLGPEAGAAYVFEHVGGRWVERQKLTAPDGSRYDRFGGVALEGNTLAVTATRADGRTWSTGAVYVFHRSAGTWEFEQKLSAVDGESGDAFGSSVALQGDELFVGARLDDNPIGFSGSAHVFRRGAGGWTFAQKLGTNDPVWDQRFGNALAVDGDLLAVGAFWDDDRGYYSGSVYVFLRIGDNWVRRWKIRPDDGHYGSSFGHSVMLRGGRLTIGAPGMDGSAGAAYFYRLHGHSQWQFLGRRVAHDRRSEDSLGVSLARVGGIRAFGASGADGGAVYLEGMLPISSYVLHGDHSVRVIARDGLGVEAADSVSFTIDTVPPRVRLHSPWGRMTVPFIASFRRLFSAHDGDRAEGQVLHERALWDGCVLYDGDTYGNGDGLLRDETLVFDAPTLCEGLLRCDLPGFVEPVVRVEATDCAGNVGFDTQVIPVDSEFSRERCE